MISISGAHYCTGHIRIQCVLNDVFTVGPSCAVLALIPFARQLNLSGSLRLGIRERKKERKALVDEMTIHNKGKERMQQRKQNIPRQIMRECCGGQTHSKMKQRARRLIDALKTTLWEHSKDVPLESSIVLPEEEDEPAVLAIQNTALGDASADLLEGAAKPWIDNSKRDRLIKLCELIDDVKAKGGR
jgi:hypothetical protein